MTPSTSRATRVKVAAAVGLAAVLGLASLAAAAPGDPAPAPPAVEPAPVDPVPTPSVTDDPEVVGQPAPDGPAVVDPAPSVPDAEAAAVPADASGTCLTHGDRVAAVAHSTPPGPGHGAAVREVAHDHTGECVHPADPIDGATDDSEDQPAPAATVPAEPAASPVAEHAGPKGPARVGGPRNGHGHGAK